MLLTGCSPSLTGADRSGSESAEKDGFFFDTTVDIIVNGENAGDLADAAIELCKKMELVFSATNKNSELYQVNHRSGNSVSVSDDLRDCLEKALFYCELSGGHFDVTIFPVSSLWDFHTTSDPQLPEVDEIVKQLKKVDYTKVHLDGNTLTFDSEDTMIDLGAIAKGYISKKIADFLIDEGCSSALINLGGNVHALGSKTSGTAWKVGIQKPFAERGVLLDVIDVTDQCVITSGTYERYFTVDGRQYHHILDALTGWPAETGLSQVTVIGDDDAACDAIATIALAAGKEMALEAVKTAGLSVRMFGVDENGELSEW